MFRLSEPKRYNNLKLLLFNFSKKDFFSSSSFGRIFKSNKPTVEAFCGKKFNAFQFLLIKLFFFKIF